MPAKRSVHHSHQHAASLSTDNTHETGHPLQNVSPRTSRAAAFRGTAVGTDPLRSNRVYEPPFSGSIRIVICPCFISHLAFAHEVCRRRQLFGSLIRHARSSAPFSLRIPVILATFRGAAVLAARLSRRPLSSLCTARIAAVRVAPIAVPMNMKQGAAPAAGDLVEFRPVLGEATSWTLETEGCIIPLFRQSSEERGYRPPPPPLPSRRSSCRSRRRRASFRPITSASVDARTTGHCKQNTYIAPPSGGGTAGLRPTGEQRKPIPLSGIGWSRGAVPPSSQNADPGKGRLMGPC